MKKNIFKTILCSTIAMSLTTSCELDQYPEGMIPADKAWEKMDDAVNFYNGLLNDFRNVSLNSAVTVDEVQADLFNMRKESSYMSDIHEWTFSSTFGAGDGCWNGNYGMISTANNILDHVDAIPVLNDVDSINFYEVKGASLFARAWGYSNMAQRFCKPYNANTAAEELGLPLVTTVDINAKPSRSTLLQTYALIEQDLTTATDLLNKAEILREKVLAENPKAAGFLEPAIDHPGVASALALTARVALYMGKYEEAESAAKSLFNVYPLTTADAYANLWEFDEGDEIIFMPLMTPVSGQRGGFGDTYLYYYEGRKGLQPYYIPTQGLMNLYEDNDVRKSAFFVEENIGVADEVEPGMLFNKYPGNPSLLQSKEDIKTNRYNMVKVFRTSEMYLIAAEAALFKANRDETAALSYLNELRANRGASALKSSGEALTKDMKTEWIREMVGEGFRLNSLKRWNDDVVRMAPQTFEKDILANTPDENYTKFSLKATDNLYFKMVWEIPENDLRANPNLVPNWK